MNMPSGWTLRASPTFGLNDNSRAYDRWGVAKSFPASAISQHLFGGAREGSFIALAVSERSRRLLCAAQKGSASRKTCKKQCHDYTELTKAPEKAR